MENRADRIAGLLDALRAEAGALGCGGFLARLDALHRTDLLTRLVYDRLQRKYETAEEIYRRSGQNWNQTFYTLLFRYMGDPSNRETYMELARRASYGIVLREQRSLARIEALLFGTAGLLDGLRPDDYIRQLRAEFDYLRSKYGIEPLDPGRWRSRNIRPDNAPHLRIAQLATFLAGHDFLFEQVVACRTPDQVRRLFGAEASAYWVAKTRSSPDEHQRSRRVGRLKGDIFGINLVSILQYAYGSYTRSETLRERAIALLESIPPEENRYMRRWSAYGLRPANAFETQGLLQLAVEYCGRGRCEQCPVARRIIDGILREEGTDE
ncbi:MAG: DUF2851 family protein [Alistipes sp.]|nr:DUF2851 family protein [Alistipes sp.]